ncbi:MAG: TerC family protein [Alphaproteobacteria bacterium]|nr:TerC family protein [Alphaproteobacteria bacterium]MBR6729845.1 TerC family protein [Alphaproteobacteria bacterium]
MLEALSHLSTGVMWGVFGLIVCTILFLDLFVFHKKSEMPTMKGTFKICLSYVIVSLLFGLFVLYEKGMETGMLFYTGYLVEFSLSMDNIFVISLIFTSLKVPAMYQHRVLFWGVLGAVVMRAVMILIGAQLVSQFHWVLYLFSAFLIYTGAKMLIETMKDEEDESASETEGKMLSFVKKYLPMTNKIHEEHFFIKQAGKWVATPLFLALVIIETMDVIFAIDSIPAIFLITQDVFVVYTSNIFAILGLRSLYFLLAQAVTRFVYLKHALSFVLIFIGSKIFLPYIGLKVTTGVSLIVTFGILALGILFSLYQTRKSSEELNN